MALALHDRVSVLIMWLGIKVKGGFVFGVLNIIG